MKLGDRVKELRQKHGWSQLMLADFSGLSQATISQIELDRDVRVRAIKCIAYALEMPLSKLFEGVEIGDPFKK